jgi:hypothetical protein
MQRQTLDAEQEAIVSRQRAYHKDQADRGDDDYLPEADRRNREHVLGPNCSVKRDDDVLIGTIVYRVIGPARQEGRLYLLAEAPYGWADFDFAGADITDRAPADPNEEPLPIFLEPEEEPDPNEGGGEGEPPEPT